MFADSRRPAPLPLSLGVVRATTAAAFSLACLAQTSCTHVDRARRASDLAAEAGQSIALQAVVEASVERQRLRRLRCIDPLLTPATISSAAADARLGQPWVDELLRDCPAFSAFVIESAMNRLAVAGLSPRPLKSQRHE